MEFSLVMPLEQQNKKQNKKKADPLKIIGFYLFVKHTSSALQEKELPERKTI